MNDQKYTADLMTTSLKQTRNKTLLVTSKNTHKHNVNLLEILSLIKARYP